MYMYSVFADTLTYVQIKQARKAPKGSEHFDKARRYMKKSVQIAICLATAFSLGLLVSTSAASDPEVYQIQEKLKELGYYHGTLDGIWGNKTESAVEKFQRDSGLPVTGELDRRTRAQLGMNTREKANPWGSGSPPPKIRVFEKGVLEPVGRNQSQEAVEAFALEKAKRLALEEAGTYISTLTVVEQGRMTRDQIIALTAGIVRTEIIGVPEPSVRSDVVYIRVKARIKVDLSVLEKKVQALMTNRAHIKQLEAEQEKVRKLEKELASVKRTDERRLKELKQRSNALELQREKRRLFLEEKRLKAKGDIEKVTIGLLKQEKERLKRFEKLIEAQEKARKEEFEAIAREQDRIRIAHLENERYIKELMRKAELAMANWLSLDDTHASQALDEAKHMRREISSINKRFDFQLKTAENKLMEAYARQISATRPILPPDPKPRDMFETTDEYSGRLAEHGNKVAFAKTHHQHKAIILEKERDLELAQFRLAVSKQWSETLDPFSQRLRELQSKKYVLPDEKVHVELGRPEADHFHFPLYLEYNNNKWKAYLEYKDRNKAKAFWETRKHIMAQGLFQLGDIRGELGFHFVDAEVIHPGTGQRKRYALRAEPKRFRELAETTEIKKEIARLKIEVEEKKLKVINSEIDRFTHVAASPFGRDMKETVWKSMIAKYPESKGTLFDDICGFKLKIGAVSRDGRYIACHEGVVRDTLNGIEWVAGPDGPTTYDEARKWVAALAVAGGGWRMPSREELKTLYQKGKGSRNNIINNITPLLKTTGWWVWFGGYSLAWNFNLHCEGDGYWGYRSDHRGGRAFAVRSR